MQRFGDNQRIGKASAALHDAKGIANVEQHRTHDGQIEMPEFVR